MVFDVQNQRDKGGFQTRPYDNLATQLPKLTVKVHQIGRATAQLHNLAIAPLSPSVPQSLPMR
jgi:hypothetical protein